MKHVDGELGYGIYPEWALNCLIGLPSTNLWQTTVVGYRANIWRSFEDDGVYSHTPMSSKVFETEQAATKWAKQTIRNW